MAASSNTQPPISLMPPQCAVNECSNHGTERISFLQQDLCEEHHEKYQAGQLHVYKLSGSSASKKSINPFSVAAEPYRIRRFRKGNDKNPELSRTGLLERSGSDPLSPETLRGMGQRVSGFLDVPSFEIEEENQPRSSLETVDTPAPETRPTEMRDHSSEVQHDYRSLVGNDHPVLPQNVSEIWKHHPANKCAIETIYCALQDMNYEARRLNAKLATEETEKEYLKEENERLERELTESRKKLKRCMEDLEKLKKRQKQNQKAFKTFSEEFEQTEDSEDERNVS